MNNQYLRTALITLCIALACVIWVYVKEIKDMHAINNTPSEEEIILERKKQLDKLLFSDKTNPYNFKTNLEIALLYDAMGDKNAERYYKRAIEYSPHNTYEAQFKLANHYLKYKDISSAKKTLEKIPKIPKKKNNSERINYYQKLGKFYESKENYTDAIKAYEEALCIHPNNNQIREELLKIQLEFADKKVKEKDLEGALVILRGIHTPSIKKDYKIALLLIKDNPEEALKYFEKIYYKDPINVNPDIFYGLLDQLEKIETSPTQKELYRIKKNKLKKFIEKNIAFADDLEIVKIEKKGDCLIFKVKNTSFAPLKTLYVGKNDDKQLHNILTRKKPLSINELSPDIKIYLKGEKNIKIYYSKNPQINKVLIYETNL